MTTLHAADALTPDGWRSDVRLTIEAGRIGEVETGVPAGPGDERQAILLPGMANLHSHAFQRGMAGLAERRGPGADTFWSWREVMYRFALTMTPDQVEAVAAQLYVEMIEAGFCRVGEFHYLHHDRDGRPYADITEMASRIAAAASATGIGLTLLPVFYAHSNFGGASPNAGQRRFISDLDGFARLMDGCRAIAAGLDHAVLGLAPHSLRAATPDEIAALLPLGASGPIHMHIAEQEREVADCLAWSGQRPVEWLLDHVEVDRRWCLIHATHMTEAETVAMAASGAVAGLCPITEASLGDGIFNGPRFVEAGGAFGIGSDSNIEIGVDRELRQLEYAQRLNLRMRNVMAVEGASTGRMLFDAARAGGRRALDAPSDGIAPGAPADLVSLDAGHEALAGLRGDAILDSWIFTGHRLVDCVWVAGRKEVERGRHRRRDEIGRAFRAAVTALRSTAL